MTEPAGRVVRFATLRPEPWANGAGTTVELFRTPSSGAFHARLSIATVAGAAPFSLLPGVDRSLLPLSPNGLVLRVSGRRRALAPHERFDFPGESRIAAEPQQEPGRDLNLMVRRGFGTPRLAVETIDGERRPGRGDIALVVLSGDLTAGGGRLDVDDAVIGLPVSGSGVVAVARIDRR